MKRLVTDVPLGDSPAPTTSYCAPCADVSGGEETVQLMYGVDGKRRLTERRADVLEHEVDDRGVQLHERSPILERMAEARTGRRA